FWIKSSKTGTYGLAISNGANNRRLVETFTIDAPNTWEFKAVTFTHDTTGTWSYAVGQVGLYCTWTLTGGSSFQAPAAGAWNAANYTTTAAQANWADTAAATLFLAKVQIEPGPRATAFEQIPYGEDLRSCRRYFQK